MIKQGICVKKEAVVSEVGLIVDENNIECAKYFIPKIDIEIGDYLCNELGKPETKLVYSKDFDLKKVDGFLTIDTTQSSDKKGQYFHSIITTNIEYDFKVFTKKESEALMAFLNIPKIQNKDVLYFVIKKEKCLSEKIIGIFSSGSSQFFVEKDFNTMFKIIKEEVIEPNN